MTQNDFDQYFRTWTAAACSEWKWREPDQGYFRRAYERLPEGLRTLIAHGVASGLIIPRGRQFTLRGLAPIDRERINCRGGQSGLPLSRPVTPS